MPPSASYIDLFQWVGTREYFSELFGKYTHVNILHTHKQNNCHFGKVLRSVWQKDSVTVSGVCLKICHLAAQWMTAPCWSCRVTGRLNHLAHSISFFSKRTILTFSSSPPQFGFQQCKNHLSQWILMCSTWAHPVLYLSPRRTRVMIRAAAFGKAF